MTAYSKEQKIYYTLRIAVAMCFIGHGAFGIITKEVWCNYFAVVGIGRNASYTLMPWVGMMDILMGIIILFYPARFIALWLVFWGLLTAAMRPLSGEPFAEFIERAGNYGAPLVLLMVAGGFSLKSLFAPLKPVSLDEKKMRQVIMALRIIVFLLLAGHGWLNIIEKKGLVNQYAGLGFASPETVALYVGIAEIIIAFVVLFRPSPQLLIMLFIWKMVSEMLYPNWVLFEWIERGGSYGSILALWFAYRPSGAPLKNNIITPGAHAPGY